MLGVLFEVLVAVRMRVCKIDGRVLGLLGGMQFGVLVQVLFWGPVWGAVRDAGDEFGAFLRD